MLKVLIVNGPNLNLLGKRETELYGNRSFEDYLAVLKEGYIGFELEHVQSNLEGELIEAIQKADGAQDGIILNAGGYTHTSVALRDAIAAIKTPVVEVHITNPYAREDFRQQSLLAPVCKGMIAGFGLEGYALALDSFVD